MRGHISVPSSAYSPHTIDQNKVTKQRKILIYFGYMEKLNRSVGKHLLCGQKENISM